MYSPMPDNATIWGHDRRALVFYTCTNEPLEQSHCLFSCRLSFKSWPQNRHRVLECMGLYAGHSLGVSYMRHKATQDEQSGSLSSA